MIRIVRSIYVYSEFNEDTNSCWTDYLEHKILVYLNYGKGGETAVYTPKFHVNLKNREESIFLSSPIYKLK